MVPYYYPRVIERVSTAILDVFNDIKINRFDINNDVVKIIDVPLIYHYNKNFAEFIMNTSRNKESRHTTPIMGLRLNSLRRDQSRTTQQKKIRMIYDEDRDTYLRDRRPSAWKLNFTLSIYAENIEDFVQIIENTLTYFDPTITLSIKEFEKVNIERDVILTLNDPDLSIEDEVDRDDRQSYTLEVPLSAAVVLYPPVSAADIIKFIRQDIAIDNKNVGEIQNDGIYPSTVQEYKLKIGEMVEDGNIPDSVNVSRIITDADNTFKIVINVSDSGVIPLKTIPANSVLVYAEIQIVEKFNSFSTKISIGTDKNNESIMKSSENNPYFVAKYASSFEMDINSDTNVNVYYTRSSATEGNAVITLAWK